MTRIEKETIIRALEQHAKSQSDIEQNARERGEPDLAIKVGREKNVAVGLVVCSKVFWITRVEPLRFEYKEVAV